MNRLFAVLGISLFLGGCISTGIAPPKEATAQLRNIHIVAMEPHPLGVPPGFGSVVLGSGGSIETARGFAVFNTIAILSELPEASKRSRALSQSYQAALDQKGAWVPTVVLANEIQAQLAAQGIQATVAPQVKPIPGVKDRSPTLFMENWLAPIRAWYNDTVPAPDYGDLPRDKSLYVLEVGVINYEIDQAGGLLLQVAMKVIDPSSGKVIGRTRAANPWNMPKLAPLDQAFAGNASRFKDAFVLTGRESARTCLTELGLLGPGRE